ncbi:hypothetical protein [Leptospira jelokensis]|uniref:hypothetical protein n=1 Tax=Leptospira jelokensis TaxID=2484931 RepID=UPI0014386444|nr:hypothetical protein [Leptospira jelokensis]
METISLYIKRNFKFNFDKDPNLTKGLYLFLLLFSLSCSNQKEYCESRAETKGGEKYQDSKSACATYLVMTEIANTSEAQGRSPFTARIIASEAFATWLIKISEERKCDQKSEYVPHFGD